MKYQTMLPIAAALSLALAAGCERRDETGTTRTTAATPSQMDDLVRDAASSAAGTTGARGATDTTGATGMNDTAGAAGTTSTTGATLEQAQPQKPLDKEDKEFITKAAHESMAEVALGTVASQKATVPDVKSFADRMVSDHTKASDELKALAAKKGVTLPTEIEKAEKNEQDRLSKMTGKKFDKEYAAFIVKDNEHDVKAFQKAAKEAKDPDVKAWAEKMAPVIEEHLKAAKELEPKVKEAKEPEPKVK